MLLFPESPQGKVLQVRAAGAHSTKVERGCRWTGWGLEGFPWRRQSPVVDLSSEVTVLVQGNISLPEPQHLRREVWMLTDVPVNIAMVVDCAVFLKRTCKFGPLLSSPPPSPSHHCHYHIPLEIENTEMTAWGPWRRVWLQALGRPLRSLSP